MSRKIRNIAEKRQEKADSLSLKLGTLVDSLSALQELSRHPMPAKNTFQVAKILRVVNAEYSLYEEARKSLLEKYGSLDEVKNAYEIKPENRDALQKEYDELREQEIVLQVSPLKLDLIAHAPMSAASMLALEWLIVE